MKIANVKVYDLEESVVASGYPMRVDLSQTQKDITLLNLYKTTPELLNADEITKAEKHISRAKSLLSCGGASGHPQMGTGIRIAFDLTCTNKMWVEMERYRFVEFVSSQSTMHRIAKMDFKDTCNEYVTDATISEINRLKEIYLKTGDKENYLRLLYNAPSGLELTARLTTNYRELKTIYYQRRDHRLPEWREFCKWIETLPYAKEFICNKEG